MVEAIPLVNIYRKIVGREGEISNVVLFVYRTGTIKELPSK